jgi:hypothetical protein
MLADILSGAVSGFLATGPMTAFMEGAFRKLPLGQRQPLPPRQVTERLMRRLLPIRPPPEERQQAVSMAAHFAFGATLGALLNVTVGRALRPGVGTGAASGLLVWAIHYAGLLPLMGLQPPPRQRPIRRNALMVAAHVVWGGTFGWLLSHLATYRETAP